MNNPYEPDPERSAPPRARTGPTPEDPREHEPMRDPPIYPDHDDVGVEEIRQARGIGGIESPDPSPDAVVDDAD